MIPLPKILADFMGYSFYFYSNENDEPVHVHVSKGNPSSSSAKFWIKRDSVELEHNNAQIPQKDLKRIYNYICINRQKIVFAWYQFFGF